MAKSNKTLLDRCGSFLGDRIDRLEVGGDDDALVDELQAFVLAEIARKAAPEFVGARPLVLFFPDDASRDEVVAAFAAEHPGAKAIKVHP